MATETKFLSDIPKNQEVEIVSIEGAGPVQDRVVEMGCLPGTRIELLTKQAFNGPIIAKLRDVKIAIRHSDAQQIKVAS